MPQDPLSQFTVSQAQTPKEADAAFRLRHDVFVRELGGQAGAPGGPGPEGREQDRFDPHCRILVLRDTARDNRVVGTYRVLDREGAAKAGQFYSETEYDLDAVLGAGRAVLEFGRSCLHPDYRGGPAMHAMWTHILDMVRREKVSLLFGVASFHGADPKRHAQALSILHHNHLAEEALRPVARSEGYSPLEQVTPEELDRKAAMRAMPALIKAYLRLGAQVGEGAFVDRAFNTTDICILLDMDRLNARQSRLYERAGA